MPDTESCQRCKFSRGPLVLICVKPQSEFFKAPVHAEGYCPWFESEHWTTELARSTGHD